MTVDLQTLSQQTTPQPSLLVQYRPATLPSHLTDSVTGITAVTTATTMMDANDDERALMDQPCPAPLRLVIQHV